MRPLKTKIHPLGGSACVNIPLVLAKMYEWGPGAVVRAKLTPGGGYFEKEVRALYGGRSAGIIVPKDVLEAHDLIVGDEVEVPYFEWITVKPVAWEVDSPASKKPVNKKTASKAA